MTLNRRMFTGSRLSLLGVAIVFFMLSAFPAAAVSKGMITSFSADWVMTSPGGAVLSISKLYMTPEAYRMDGMPMGGKESKNITSLGLYKQNKEYLYNHDKKLVFEGEFDEQARMQMLNLFENVDSEVVLGKDKVSGYACTKKKVTTTVDMMGMKVTSTQIIWQSDRFEMPIRTQTEDGYLSELRNIDTKRPPGNLFKPFTGYTRVDNMMAVLGMDFSGVEAAEARAERRERIAKGDLASDPPPKDIRDTDVDSFMGSMEKLMGAMGADPEQTAVLREVFSHALKTDEEIRPSERQAPTAATVPPSSPTGPDRGETIIVFDRIEATDTLFNSEPVRLSVFRGRWNEDALYLVEIEDSGTGLVDPVGNRVCHADAAVLLFGGRQMRLDLGAVQLITPSGAEVFTGRSRERIEAWWEESNLTFTVARTKQAPFPKVPVSVQTKAPETGLLFPNSDFEHGDLTNWHATGTAFDYQPTKGDNPTARRRGQPSNHRGDYWIGTFEKYQGLPGQQPGQTQGDRPTGTLTSMPFKIAGDSISFLVGGGGDPDSIYVALVVGGREVLKATGINHETMKRVTWDVSEFRDREAIIVIVDRSNRGWGHINADDFRYGTGD